MALLDFLKKKEIKEINQLKTNTERREISYTSANLKKSASSGSLLIEFSSNNKKFSDTGLIHEKFIDLKKLLIRLLSNINSSKKKSN